MDWLKVPISLIWLATAAAPAAAQSPGTSPGGNTGQHLGKAGLPGGRMTHPDEHLAMPEFPMDWTKTTVQTGPVEVFEYFPKTQTANTWRDKITLEVHHGANTLPLDAYHRRAFGMLRENCEGVFEGGLQTGVNNGFPAAYWTMGCKHDNRGNFGETRYTKAIQGGGTLYLLSRSWRTPVYDDRGPPLTPQVLEQARQFLGSSVVCTNTPEHPCPKGGKNGTP